MCHKNQREQQGMYIAQEKCNCNRRKTKEKSQKCSWLDDISFQIRRDSERSQKRKTVSEEREREKGGRKQLQQRQRSCSCCVAAAARRTHSPTHPPSFPFAFPRSFAPPHPDPLHFGPSSWDLRWSSRLFFSWRNQIFKKIENEVILEGFNRHKSEKRNKKSKMKWFWRILNTKKWEFFFNSKMKWFWRASVVRSEKILKFENELTFEGFHQEKWGGKK